VARWAPVIVAPFVGSFLAVAGLRWGSVESALHGRSRCDACRETLGPLKLVPLLSYAALRGRCAHCAVRIAPWHPAIEFSALALAIVSVLLVPPPFVWLTVSIGWVLLLMSAIDVRTYILPDALTLPLLAAGLVFGALQQEALGHVAGAAAGWLVSFAVAMSYRYARGRDGLGGGDVKLFAAAGAWVGLSGLPTVMFYGAGTGLAVVLAGALAGRAISGTTRIPFGPFLAFGFFVTWLVRLLPQA
jgi:leader peptidase (prepilin peptidase)/N-methyltransferase